MTTLEEQFEGWLKKERSPDGEVYVTNGDAFFAGAAAEREAVLAIVEEVRHLFDGNVPDNTPARANIEGGRDACHQITRRIRQRGEAEAPRKEK